MVKEEKTSEDVIIELWAAVVKKQMTMTDADNRLRAYVKGLPEEQQTEFRQKAGMWGLWISSVTGAFQQQLTVLGAGQ